MERERSVFHESASRLQTTSEGNADGPEATTEMQLAVWIFPWLRCVFDIAGKKSLHNSTLTLLVNDTQCYISFCFSAQYECAFIDS